MLTCPLFPNEGLPDQIPGLLRLRFRLEGCTSLKEKRSRLRGIKDKFGKRTNLAVCEADDADDHRSAHWWFVASSASARVVEQMLMEAEHHASLGVDAEVVAIDREWLV